MCYALLKKGSKELNYASTGIAGEVQNRGIVRAAHMSVAFYKYELTTYFTSVFSFFMASNCSSDALVPIADILSGKPSERHIQCTV